MNAKLRKIAAMTAAVLITASAVSCSKNNSRTSEALPAPAPVTQVMYKEERMRLPDDFSSIIGTSYVSDTGETAMLYTDKDGRIMLTFYDSEFTQKQSTVLVDEENLHSYSADIAPDGSITLLLMFLEYDKPEITDYEDYFKNSVKTFEIRSCTPSGELTETVTIENFTDYYDMETAYISQFLRYGENSYIIDFFDGWALIDGTGAVIDVQAPEDIYFLGHDINSNTIAISFENYGYLDGETLNLPTETTDFDKYIAGDGAAYPGPEGYMAYFPLNEGIFGFTEDKEFVKILDYSDSNIISTEIYSLSPVGEGKFLMVGADNDGYYMSKLTVRPDGYVENKQPVIIASNSVDDDFREDVTKFTRFSDEYKGEIRTYDYDEHEELVQDILAGDAPDVYVYSDTGDMHDLTNMGALADMYELSEQYGGFTKDDILDNVIEAMEYKDGLYGIIPNFYLECYYANREVVGEEYTFWNYDEFFSIAENMPEDMALSNYWGFQTRDDVFSFMCLNSLSSWIDFENASCRFDSEEFIRVLEFCRDVNILGERPEYLTEEDTTAADTEDMLRVKNKQALMMPLMGAGCPSDIVRFAATSGLGQDGVTLLAPPSEDKSGKLGIWGGELYSVMNSGKCTEGGWEFVNYIMSYDRQIKQHNFCTRKDAFEDHIKADQEQQKGAWNGEVSAGYGNYSVTYDPSVSDEMLDYVRDYISKCTNVKDRNVSLNEILTEEFSTFINGEISAEECAKRMQNRVSIYLSENA